MPISRRQLIAGSVANLTTALVCSRAGIAETLDRHQRAIARLRRQLRGRMVLPDDAAFESARQGLGSTPVDDKFPAMIVLVADSSDIVRALDFARSSSLVVAVRAGGHDVLGASTCDGGLLIDLSMMNGIQIDPTRGTARVATGVRSGELNAAAEPHSLAPVLGQSPHIGVSGLTLGGGIGWLCGRYGAACDNLLSAELVDADGRIVRASASENADLYWGIRGGGGNFGIATELLLKLQPVDPVIAGLIGFRADVGSFLRTYRDFLESTPDPLDLAMMISFGDQPTIMLGVCWSGELSEGNRILSALRSLGSTVFDTVKSQSYAHFVNSGGPSQENLYWRGGELAGLSDAVIEKISSISDARPPKECVITITHFMHGVLCQQDPYSTPFIRQPGHLLYNVDALWHGRTHPNDRIQWVNSVHEQLQQLASKQTYINYLSDDSESAVRNSYGSSFERLRAVKRKFDPANIFCGNRNVRP